MTYLKSLDIFDEDAQNVENKVFKWHFYVVLYTAVALFTYRYITFIILTE